MLDKVELNPENKAEWAVVWLHGLGADGNDFVPAVPELRLPADASVKFVFPHAPVRPVTVNGGMPMRAWYDILAMGEIREVNEAHLGEARTQLFDLLDGLNEEGIPDPRIVLIGFSQGGALGYHGVIDGQRAVAGLACLSTYRIGDTASATADTNLPIFVAHGDWDPVVPQALGRAGFESLCREGYRPSWHSYPMEHQVCIEELRDLGQWLKSRVGIGEEDQAFGK
ncbi:alpha/beta hydrolase [Motiliproteus sp. SC1-56]|uniref:alpha/beta hydrolase n=1 Tax=Motiliproteus sp. SC1-56 TaxID=2799565 RepID=UPI001A8CE5D5|nr:carboxylesterase [Motiliproteus sp. SC1-56]